MNQSRARKVHDLHDILTTDDVARLFQLNPKTVERLARRGSIPGRRVAKKWRFSPSKTVGVRDRTSRRQQVRTTARMAWPLWCEMDDPRVVAQIEVTEWILDGHLRHPSFVALRADKDVQTVVREKPILQSS